MGQFPLRFLQPHHDIPVRVGPERFPPLQPFTSRDKGGLGDDADLKPSLVVLNVDRRLDDARRTAIAFERPPFFSFSRHGEGSPYVEARGPATVRPDAKRRTAPQTWSRTPSRCGDQPSRIARARP